MRNLITGVIMEAFIFEDSKGVKKTAEEAVVEVMGLGLMPNSELTKIEDFYRVLNSIGWKLTAELKI